MFKRRSTLLILTLLVGAPSTSVSAHELWLDGVDYQIGLSDQIVANIKVGEAFRGSSFSYLPGDFERFDIAVGETIAEVEGRIGDRPAVNVSPLAEGLNVIVYQSDDKTVFYREWEKFAAFIEHKDFKGAEQQHDARGLPRTEFRELYSRYAKSLFAAGNGQGADRAYGLETEIVALENPYTDDMSDGVDVQVLYQGQPRADAQVEVFEKLNIEDDTEVATFFLRTDAEGVATIPVKPGFEYQVDAVVLREPAAEVAQTSDVVWETLWANLTFAVPAR